MGHRKNRARTPELWVAADELPPIDFVQAHCGPFYATTIGRPTLMPGTYFRLLLIGYFEGIDSERGIAWAHRRLARAAWLSGLGPGRGPARALDDLADAAPD